MNAFTAVNTAQNGAPRRRLAGDSSPPNFDVRPPWPSNRLSAMAHDWKRITTTALRSVAEERKPERRIVLRRVTVFDPDQLGDIIPGANVEHRLLEPGPFEAQALHLETPTFRLDHLRYSAGVALNGEMPAGGVAIGFALRMPEDMVAFGIPQRSFALMHFDPSGGLDLRLPAGGEWVVLSIDRGLFEAELLRRRGEAPNSQATERLPLRIPDPQRRRLASLLKSVIDDAAKAPGMQRESADVRDCDGALFGAVVDAYISAQLLQSGDHGALARRRRLVSRAEDYIYAHIDDSIRMKRLCRDIGASARTLEYAFKGVYGIGAMESLRVLRLNEVRKKLLRSGAGEITVTTAAMDWGFWHLGEFAAGYRRLFGELPSQTLQTRRRQPTLHERHSNLRRFNDAASDGGAERLTAQVEGI